MTDVEAALANGNGGSRRAIGYVCLTHPAEDELARRSHALRACCAERGLLLTRVVHDVDPYGQDRRPSLVWALEQLADRRADALVLTRLHDLSANPLNLRPLLTWFDHEHRTLIALDPPVDTSVEGGRVVALANARLRDGGRFSVADIPELQERIAIMRESGMTLQAIADRLNAEGVPTLRGGAKWRPSSVQRATGYRRPPGRGVKLSN
ncbi:recombinase family protein [Solirubrobacter sp. CPCC 204708]|uniref:Recombinase family protein n=1 Tax=Solirubrobacter deserti TaxID=2282478 RepID=A0ABT4RF58_9ACTN|nr:recombinase family protein [Solirubrobacter deserti]MBE2319522.1 recombinase family protein [Solirubrobacter deserti]MDA0137191.1 recombinase family protein [Solirubrobacter deserti]